MTQELQASLYDVLRLVVGSDIAQPEERELAFATAVELTKQYPFIGFEGPIETLPIEGTFDWALTMMRAQPGKAFTYGINQSEYHFDAESGGFEYLTDSAPWRVVSGWALSTRDATDWREVSSGQTEVAQNVEGPFDRETAARLGDEFGIEFIPGDCVHWARRNGAWHWWDDEREWVQDPAGKHWQFKPVHNLAWAKWAMKQGVELLYGNCRHRWSGSRFEVRGLHSDWLDSLFNSEDAVIATTEDWRVAK